MSKIRKPTKRQLDYWDKRLQEEELDMTAGLNPKPESYAGSCADLSRIEEIKFAESSGCGGGRRTKPKRQSE